jgi:two-component system cell cycle sensor histidine kinase/response regulator CckA
MAEKMDDRQKTREALIREIETLRESEKKWRQWFEDAPISLWEQDYSEVKRRVDEIRDRGVGDLEAYFQCHPDLCRELAALVRVVDVNKFTLRLYRARTREDLLSGITRVFSRVSYESFIANLMTVAEGRTRFFTERIHVALDGEILHVQLHWAVAPGYEDTYGRVLVSIVDITDRQHAEEALRESENKYRIVLESMEEGYHEVDLQGRFTFLNESSQKILGYSHEELMGMSYRYFAADETNRNKVAVAYNRIFTTGEILHDFVWDIVRKDGLRRTIEVSASLIRDKDNHRIGFRGLVRDITERVHAEADRERLRAQLAQAQKMESVGRLAGGVAHDFNNMLSVILGHAEMALMQVEPSDPLHRRLRQIQESAMRSANLVRQLLAFARKQTVAPKVLDLNNTVAGMLKMLRRLIGEDIDLVWMPGANLWPVKMDPSQIDQVLANLCVNARDAIVDVGKVTIETENVVLDEAYCASHAGFMPGQYTVLAVGDNGCGMDKEILVNLFDPFFTTKEVGKGTGLGLATVYGIVKQNSGFINVHSEPDQGTTFRIYLPRHGGKAPQDQECGSLQAVAGGNEAVLLVEDEPMLLGIGRSMLEQLGYRVLSAGGPDEAIRLAEADTGEIHLLMTDVVMPAMNGKELARRLAKLRPAIKTLFMSGYTANVIAHHGVLNEGVHFIQKPFSIKDLSAKVREAIDR